MPRTRYQGEAAAVPLRKLPAAALRAVLREGYGWADLQADALAGLVVGVVALPLSMALAIAVGAPPIYGVNTAIVSGFITALLGGSRVLVAGPTAAFVVILAPIYAKFGASGLLLAGFLGGLLLVGLGLARLGRLIEFIPHPVTTGFTSGIALVIATLQLKDFFGLTFHGAPDSYFERLAFLFEARHTASIWEPALGGFTLAILLLWPRVTRRMPAPLVALTAATVLAWVLGRVVPGFHVATIASRFGAIPRIPPLPSFPWSMDVMSFHTLRTLMPDAVAVAMLGAIESLLAAVVADGMCRTRHDPDAELLAQGIANIVGPFFGAIPSTGAIARTATNIRSGARSPIAAMVHSLTVLAAILVFAPLLSFLPMSSLAALLLLVAWNMSEAQHFAHILRVAPRSDVAVLLTCFGLTVSFDMVVGVSVGMVLAALFFMGRMAEVTRVHVASGTHPELPGPVPPGVSVYEISGPLFFGAAQKAMGTLNVISDRTRAVILLMDGVQTMDATGLVALESALTQLQKKRCLAILSGVGSQPRALMERAQLLAREGVVLCADGAAAFALASAHAQSPVVTTPTR